MMGSSSEGDDSGDLSNLGKKRRLNEGNEVGYSKGKKLKLLGRNDEEFRALEKIGSEKEESIQKGEMGFEEPGFEKEMNFNSEEEVPRGGGLYTCEEKRTDFDLNVVQIDSDDEELVPVVGADRKKNEIIDIPSDDDDSENERVKGIAVPGFDPVQEYTVDDVESWLSLTNDLPEFEFPGGGIHGSLELPVLQPGSQEPVQFDANLGIHDFIDLEAQLGNPEPFQFEVHPGPHQDSANSGLLSDIVHGFVSPPLLNLTEKLRDPYDEEMERNRDFRYSYQEEMKRHRHDELRRRARIYARSDDYDEASANQEKAPVENDSLLGKIPGPFSESLKGIRDRMSRKNEQLIAWKPRDNSSKRVAPSLVDLSLNVLAENAEAMVSLELVPDFLKNRLADTICSLRGMNAHTLELFVRGTPTEIQIKDSSWLTQEQYFKTFRNFDAKDLEVLRLELCGQCTLDYHVVRETLASPSRSLSNLQVLSLKGACRLSDDGLKAIVSSAPLLRSINLSQCTLLSNDSIDTLANSLGSRLRELYIDDCQKLDPLLILPALKKLDYLEVLSVARIQTVSDQFCSELITACGKNIKELDFADCLYLTNSSLQIIGDTCTGLRSLNISNLDKLTDVGLQYLTDGCRDIQTLRLSRNNFSDEAIAAFLEASGKSLKHLSLNNVTSVGPFTAFSLANCATELLKLDLSWCRKITNESLLLIINKCLSLKLIKLFGCLQISGAFSNTRLYPQVQILGLQLTPILGSTLVHEPLEII